MSVFHVKHSDDGYYLSDDALLYDAQAMREWYGDLIPLWSDDGNHYAFEMAESYEESVVALWAFIADDGKSAAELRGIETALNAAAGKLENGRAEQEREAPNLRFPDPVKHPNLYRIIKRLDVSSRADDNPLGVLIFYGLVKHDDACGGVKAEFVARWLRDCAEEVGRRVKVVDASLKQQVRKTENDERKKWRLAVVLVSVFIFAIITTVLTVLSLLKQTIGVVFVH